LGGGYFGGWRSCPPVGAEAKTDDLRCRMGVITVLDGGLVVREKSAASSGHLGCDIERAGVGPPDLGRCELELPGDTCTVSESDAR
jgi:hypothetical protein